MRETRSYCPEVRADQGETGTAIRGVAAVFYDGSPGTEFRLYRDENIYERIMPGAFDDALKRSDDVRALKNHESSQVLGRTKAGTLKLSVSKRGLEYETTPSDTQLYRDTLTEIKRGDVDGSSFQFTVDADEFTKEGDRVIREIRSVTLYDVGPVTFPAYPATKAAVRAVEYRSENGEWEPTPQPAQPLDDKVRRLAEIQKEG